MMIPIQAASGRIIHVVPDNEPVFTVSEVTGMHLAGYGPEQAEFVALAKEIFPTAGKLKFPSIPQSLMEETQMALLNFNTEEVADDGYGDFTPMAAGNYTAIITDSEMVENKAGTGSMLKLEFTMVEGTYANRKLFARLNLDNPNAQAVEIARKDLKAITLACGKKVVGQSQELHDIPLTIKVAVEKRKDTGEDTNNIKAYFPLNSGAKVSTMPPRQSASPPPAQAAAGNLPPWRRNAA
jgi:Protein of unknown function (DUF669)